MKPRPVPKILNKNILPKSTPGLSGKGYQARQMRFIFTLHACTWIKRVIIVGKVFALVLFFSGSAYSQDAHLAYDISISFEVENNLLIGQGEFVLPADQEARLLVAGLSELQVKVDGKKLDNSRDKEEVFLVPASGAEQMVDLTWERKVQGEHRNLIAPKGISLLGNWYPRPARDAIYSLQARVPKDFSAVSEAESIQVLEKKDKKQYSFDFPHPVSRINFVAGPYHVEEEEFGQEKILASYFFEEVKHLAGDYRSRTREYLERYMDLFGEYPYQRYAVVVNRRPTGLAMPTFTLLGQQVVRLPFIQETSLGHEVLHSWMGNAVRVNWEQGNWSEGITTYLADHAFARDRGEATEFRKNQIVRYHSYVRQGMDITIQDFTSPGKRGREDQAKRAVGYQKSSMLFHMLNRRLGEADFQEAVRDFYHGHKYGRATWQDLEQSYARAVERDLRDFFHQWLTRSDIPVLGMENPQVQKEGEKFHLSWEIVQENRDPFDLRVPVQVETAEGTVTREIEMDEHRKSVSVQLSRPPQKVVLDPEYDLMRALDLRELPPVWSAFMGAPEKLAVVQEEEKEVYAPMIKAAEQMGARVVKDNDLDEKEMQGKSLLFLGAESAACRSLLGEVEAADPGFSLKVRHHPLDPEEVAVVVQATERREVEAVAGRLRHYGKYGILHFRDGENVQKIIPETDQGIVLSLD